MIDTGDGLLEDVTNEAAEFDDDETAADALRRVITFVLQNGYCDTSSTRNSESFATGSGIGMILPPKCG